MSANANRRATTWPSGGSGAGRDGGDGRRRRGVETRPAGAKAQRPRRSSFLGHDYAPASIACCDHSRFGPSRRIATSARTSRPSTPRSSSIREDMASKRLPKEDHVQLDSPHGRAIAVESDQLVFEPGLRSNAEAFDGGTRQQGDVGAGADQQEDIVDDGIGAIGWAQHHACDRGWRIIANGVIAWHRKEAPPLACGNQPPERGETRQPGRADACPGGGAAFPVGDDHVDRGVLRQREKSSRRRIRPFSTTPSIALTSIGHLSSLRLR